jgi:CBS domain containing-hemolysin-like protein
VVFHVVLGVLVPKRVAMQKPLAVREVRLRRDRGIRFVMRAVIRLLSVSRFQRVLDCSA